jgi:hypothetical protein
VDGNHLLRVTEEGPLTLTAALSERPGINATVCTTVRLTPAFEPGGNGFKNDVILYPNPASDRFSVKGTGNCTLLLVDISGREWIQIDHYREDQAVDISGYPDGLYLVKIEGDNVTNWMKLIKQ